MIKKHPHHKCMYTRLIAPKFLQSLKTSPAVLLSGARQTGKSTLVQNLLRDTHKYMTLDDLNVLKFATQDPIAFLDSQHNPSSLTRYREALACFYP